MSGSSFGDRWRGIVEILEEGGLRDLASGIRGEATAAQAAPLTVPVIGEAGSGKSALVARVLGADSAFFPQDVLESTAVTVQVRYAPTEYRAVVRDDTGERDECGDDDARWEALVRGWEAIAGNAHLEVGLPCKELGTWNVRFADTPGLNTDTPELEGRAWAAAATAPVVVLTIPAKSAGRQTDLDYLESLGGNSASVVIVLTKADQSPSNDAGRILDAFRNLAGERGIAPLGVVTTSVTTDDDAGGIARLRQLLSDVTGRRRERLISRHVGGRVAANLRRELSKLRLNRSALESDASAVVARATGDAEDLVAEGADKESDLKSVRERLRVRCERLRLEAFTRMDKVGRDALKNVSEELRTVETREEAMRFAEGAMRRHVLQWRDACVAAAEDRLRALDHSVVSAAREVAAQHFERIDVARDWLRGLHDGTSGWHTDPDEKSIEHLHRSREELLRQIGELKAETPLVADLSRIEQALGEQREQRDALVYQPQKEVIHLAQGKQQWEDAGRVLGQIADVALTLMPIPTGGKFAMAVKKIPWGPKLMSAMHRYNGLIVARDRWLRGLVTAPGLTKVAENLSLETWGERLGAAVGEWLEPDKQVEIENAEVKQEYLARRKSYDDAIVKLEHERYKVRSRQEHVEQRLQDGHRQLEELNRLEREREQLAARRRKLDAEEGAAAATEGLRARLYHHLLSRDPGSMSADLRNAVTADFDGAHEALDRNLQEQLSTIKADVGTALHEAQAKRAQGESAVKEALDDNRTKVAAVQRALEQVEAL